MEKLDIKGQPVVEISAEVAAAIVRSNFIPRVFSGTGSLGGEPATAVIGKEDIVKMIKTDSVPKGVRIEGGNA